MNRKFTNEHVKTNNKVIQKNACRSLLIKEVKIKQQPAMPIGSANNGTSSSAGIQG